jgi:gliding motility-associated-like protein
MGCSTEKEYTLRSEIVVPRMFSPNGDNVRETFMKGQRTIIFDRHGRKLHDGNDGWDGTYNGQIMPEDVYYYLLFYKDDEGRDQKKIGYVTIIRN